MRVPKVDTITIDSIHDSKALIAAIEDLIAKTSKEQRYPYVIDMTGDLTKRLERLAPELLNKIHVVNKDYFTYDFLANINPTAGTILTNSEVKAYEDIIKGINEHGPVWLFGEKTAKINPDTLKDAFYKKALDEDERLLLKQARIDSDKITKKFRESSPGSAMFYPKDPDSIVSRLVAMDKGDITNMTIVESAAIVAQRANVYMTKSGISKFIKENNLGESEAMDFQTATKGKKILVIADDVQSSLFDVDRNTLNEAIHNGMEFVFSDKMSVGEERVLEYISQFKGVKLSSIKESLIGKIKNGQVKNGPDMIFTISKNIKEQNRASLLKKWEEVDAAGQVRIYKSSDKIMNDIQNKFTQEVDKWRSSKENFLPDFAVEKAKFGEDPKDILIDLASVAGTNKIKEAMKLNTEAMLKDYREQLMKTIPEGIDDITKRAMIKQIENEVGSTAILMKEIGTEIFKFGEGKTWLETLRNKISSRLTFYAMFDQPQTGLNPGYPDVIPEYVTALRSAEWMLRNGKRLATELSALGSTLMSVWIRAVLLYRPRWQVWNTLGDGVRAIGAAKDVMIMSKYLEILSVGSFKFYIKFFKEISKIPLEALPKGARERMSGFLSHDLLELDFSKPLTRTKYFELKSSLSDVAKLMKEGGVSATGETITPAMVERMTSPSIDRIIASPEFAQEKINLMKTSGFLSRVAKRFRVIDSDIQIVSSTMETMRRATLAWNLLYKKSMSAARAEMKIKKWQFNYRELTLAGRLMRNFFPFYTFTSESLQLYLGLCAKYGPGVWNGASALFDAFESATEDMPDQYKTRIQIGNRVWWLTNFGVQEYFNMIINPSKMMEEFIKNPGHMLFGLSFGPIGSAAMNVITGKGFYDTTASTEEFYQRGWTTEEIDNFKNKDDAKFSDSISFDKSDEAVYALLVASLPFGALAQDLTKVDIATILRGNTTMNSKKVRTLMNYFFGANYKKMEDIEIVFDTMMKLPPHEQYILKESLKRENPDLYDYLRQYSLLSKITKILNAQGVDWSDKSQNLINSMVVYLYYDKESELHGSGDEWLNENPNFKKIMEAQWATGAMTSGKIYGKEKFAKAQLESIAKKILTNVKDADDKKIAKMRLAGIEIPFDKSIKKQDLYNSFYDDKGNFRLTSEDQLVNIIDAYGLEGKLFEINNLKSEAEKGYQDWKNLSLKARDLKNASDQKYYDSMSMVFKVLPSNLEDMSQEESAKVWNKYNALLKTLILDNPEFKKKYMAEMPEWQRKYGEFNAKYAAIWTKLRSTSDDSENYFTKFSKQPAWFQKWYFYGNPDARTTYPKYTAIFNEMKKNPDADYYDLFYQKLGDKSWDRFRELVFKKNPEKKIYFPVAAIYNKTIKKLIALTGDDKSAQFAKLYDWLWAKQDVLKAWDKAKPGQYVYIEKLREMNKSGDASDYYHRFYANNDKSWKEFRKVYFDRKPLRKEYYPLALELEGKTYAEREAILKDPKYKDAIIAWNKDKPGGLARSQEYVKYEKQWEQFNSIDDSTWEGKRAKAEFLKTNPDLVKLWDNNDKPEELAIKHKQRDYFDILYQIPADGKGRDYLTKYFTLKAQADKFLKDNPDLQKYWDSKTKITTSKEKVVNNLKDKFFSLTLSADKQQFLIENPELDQYFLNLLPPGIRRLKILENLYFKLNDSKTRKSFLQARPELVEYWEVKKMPASFLTNPGVMKEWNDKLANFTRFTDAATKGRWEDVELLRKAISSEPDTTTEEGKWLADKMYTEAMKTWATTFGSIMSTYFFRALPSWIRDEYFKSHPDSRVLSYLSLGRAMEEGLRIYESKNKQESWALKLQEKYGKDMPYKLKDKVQREMIRLGKWHDRSYWSKAQWAEYNLQHLAKQNNIKSSDFDRIKFLGIIAKRVIETYSQSIFPKPLKEFGVLNVFLGSEELLMRKNLAKKTKTILFDYEL
jgi:hypothetical protein